MGKKRCRFFNLVCTVLLYSVCTVGLPDAQAKAEKLSLASFKSGSSWYVLAQTMAKLIKGELSSGSQVDVLPYSGGVGNPMVLGKGKADLALGFPVEANLALKGEPPYKEQISDLRVLVLNRLFHDQGLPDRGLFYRGLHWRFRL